MRSVTGSLYEKNNKWQMMINYYDEDGKRKQKSKSTGLCIKGNKRKAQIMLEGLLYEYSNDMTKLFSRDMPFSDYMLQWLEEYRSEVRDNTYQNYKYVVEAHIVPYFKEKGVTLKELRPRDLKAYYNFKLQTLSANTVKKHHANIHKALKRAVEYELISYNPASALDLPKIKGFVGSFYEEDEIKVLKEIVKDSPIEVPVMLTVFYGFRRSEVLGLRWQSVDFAKSEIHVEHTLIDVKGKPVPTDNTKSRESNRIMPMNEEIKKYLKEVRKKQLEKKMFYGNAYVDSGYICTYDNGEYMKPNYLSHTFKKLLEANADKIKKVRFHDLRHSSATMLLSLGFSLEDIKAWLGHSDISTTQRYAHYLDSKKQNMLDGLNKKIG